MAERKHKDDQNVLKTVLVVDDDWLIREVIALALDDAGYGVVASDGIDVPKLAREAQPAVVLLDINMPVMALSAATNLRARAAEMEANDYLAKPFDIAELLLRIEKWAGPAY